MDTTVSYFLISTKSVMHYINKSYVFLYVDLMWFVLLKKTTYRSMLLVFFAPLWRFNVIMMILLEQKKNPWCLHDFSNDSLVKFCNYFNCYVFTIDEARLWLVVCAFVVLWLGWWWEIGAGDLNRMQYYLQYVSDIVLSHQ